MEITFISAEKLEEESSAKTCISGASSSWDLLKTQHGLVICPGFGQRGIEGKILAVQYAREHDVPCFGICLGMQMMVIEFARHVLGMKEANSTEINALTTENVIDLMEAQKSVSQMGGTMRLGAYDCELQAGSRVAAIYGETLVRERHRHRYEFNNRFLSDFKAHGMKPSGLNPASGLVEIVEIPNLKWFVGTQLHPEYQSTVLHPHPLFMDFIKTAIKS